MKPCNVTVFTTLKPATLGKTYKLGLKGLEKTTAGAMAEGTYEVQSFDSEQGLVEFLSSVRTDQAISASIPANGSVGGRVLTKDAVAALKAAGGGKAGEVVLSRTKDCFSFPAEGPGLISLDYDPHGTPLTRDEIWVLLTAACPAVAECAVVWWCSGSSHVFNGETEIQGPHGQRFYLVAADGADVMHFAQVLAQRLRLAGHGRIDVSVSGSLLDRGLFDAAMFEPARLDFIGGAVCFPPLSQRRGLPVVLSEGGWLDTRAAMPDLTALEEARYVAALDDAKAKAEPAAAAARAAWVANRVAAGTAKLVANGVPSEQAKERIERTLTSALGRVLMGDFEITLEGGRVVTVGEVLDNRDRHHGSKCLDPLNPEHRGGAADGKLYLWGAVPTLFSLDDGGVTYKLCRQPARLYLAPGRKAELASDIVAWLAGEPDIFTKGNVLVQVTDGAVRPVRKHRLTHLVGSRVALYRRSEKGQDIPVDLPGDVVDMVAELVGG